MNYSKNPNNSEIRAKIRKAGLTQWQIADALGVCENTFCRMLRYELPEEKKKEILALIDGITNKEVTAWRTT